MSEMDNLRRMAQENHDMKKQARADKKVIKSQQTTIDEMEATLVRMRDEPQATESHYIKLAAHALNRAALKQEGE